MEDKAETERSEVEERGSYDWVVKINLPSAATRSESPKR